VNSPAARTRATITSGVAEDCKSKLALLLCFLAYGCKCTKLRFLGLGKLDTGYGAFYFCTFDLFEFGCCWLPDTKRMGLALLKMGSIEILKSPAFFLTSFSLGLAYFTLICTLLKTDLFQLETDNRNRSLMLDQCA
jgi:hypothetical protein